MQDLYLSVSAVTKYIKHKIEDDDQLKTVYLKGEISNFKSHTTGHYYFSIKDELSKINAVMFNNQAQKLSFVPKEGMNVLIMGRIGVYETTGSYQIYVMNMEEDGIGNLYKKYELLKEKLINEGLFLDKFKKPIPKIPSKVGVVTASTGAAIKDIITTIKRRFPIAKIYVFPCLVQGENASFDISKQLKIADNYGLDVIITGRGGGSIEDLWPFNEEIVARAIFESKTPIVSAVGHEVDFTIADFVSDLRAPTPTAAAELVVPNIIDLKNNIHNYKTLINNIIFSKLNNLKLKSNHIKNRSILKNPLTLIEKQSYKLDYLTEKIHKKIDMLLSIYKMNFKNILNNLEILNPLQTLNRGYSIVRKNNIVINDTNNLKINDKLTIELVNGIIEGNITNIKEKKNE